MSAQEMNGREMQTSGRVSVVLACIFLLLTASACGRKHRHSAASKLPPAPKHSTANTTAQQNARREQQPAPAVASGYTEVGLASWYGVPYHGRPAADGEIYDMETLVAAHRLLPFNTWLRVTNLSNQESVKVRVIDRGPFVDGRILDLSKAAARSIGLLGPGVGKIRLEVISAPPDRPTNDYYAVQIGAFSVRANAEQARVRLAARYGDAYVAMKQGRSPLWRVLVGRVPSPEAAWDLARQLSAENKDVFVVRLDENLTTLGTSKPPTSTGTETP